MGRTVRKKRGAYKKSPVKIRLEQEGITQSLVQEMFRYDSLTGEFFRRISRSGNGGRAGTLAGSLSEGYLQTRIGKKTYKIHRLIWLYVYGYFPETEIDHIDRDRLNNKIENLREASSQCNARNRKERSDNTSGVKGVYWCKRGSRWSVYICISQKKRFVGYYQDYADAVSARFAAEQCLDWHSCDVNSSAYQYLKQQGILKN